MTRPGLTPDHAVAGYSFGVRPRPTDEERAEHNRTCPGDCGLCEPASSYTYSSPNTVKLENDPIHPHYPSDPLGLDIGDGPPPGT
jgi:hypothetical protein